VICVPLILLVDEDSVSITALSMIGKAGATAAFNGMYVYTTEIYPTEVRNVGLGMCSTIARISSMIAPYVGGLFGELWAPLPSLIFGIVGTLTGVLTFFLPETFGKSLPETVEELENGISDNKPQQTKENQAEMTNGTIINEDLPYKSADVEKTESSAMELSHQNYAFVENF